MQSLATHVIRLLWRWVRLASECVLDFVYPPDN
jgi:hypothetical protein